MNDRYMVCTQAAWGVLTYRALCHEPGGWCLRHSEQRDVKSLQREVAEVDPRYVFFLNWSSYVPEDVYGRWECVNFHCTALPYGRGGGPIENLLLRGHRSTTMTAHRMTDVVDGGPVYGSIDGIALDGTKDEILARFIDPCAKLIQRIIIEEPTPVPQVGKIVMFERLPPDEFAAFWMKRS